MTSNDIKEALSNSFIKTIAYRNGIKPVPINEDHGVDLLLHQMVRIDQGGIPRVTESGKSLNLQLKATTERNVRIEQDHCVYSLEAKTYNDLVRRRPTVAPLFLILFILPDDEDQWVGLDENRVLLRKNAYWYLPENDEVSTNNTSSKTIRIPIGNLIQMGTFNSLFTIAYGI